MSLTGGLCVGPRRSLCRALCRGPALSASGPRTLCVGARRSLSGPGAFCVTHWLCRGPALFVRRSLCRGPALSVSGPGAVCVGARRSLCVTHWRCPPARFLSLSLSGPGGFSLRPQWSLCLIRSVYRIELQVYYMIRVPPIRSAGPPLRSVRHPSIRSAGPQLRSACHPSSPARSFFAGENPKPYCLGEKAALLQRADL